MCIYCYEYHGSPKIVDPTVAKLMRMAIRLRDRRAIKLVRQEWLVDFSDYTHLMKGEREANVREWLSSMRNAPLAYRVTILALLDKIWDPRARTSR